MQHGGRKGDEMFRQNKDVIKAIQWSSTLDVTTEICRIQGPQACTAPTITSRSGTQSPGDPGGRTRALALPLDRHRGGQVAVELTASRACPSSQWACGRAWTAPSQACRTANGFQKQSAAQAGRIVGPARGKLMREGKLPFDSLCTDRGVYLTLDQLRGRNAAAFNRAGVYDVHPMPKFKSSTPGPPPRTPH